ncbi:MAG: hypothetical protein J6Y02_22280 [Pseudobutyrivibrio sp.]|nr:hypothetical protein [Pseudobutyrivibrio sp.]
MSYSEIYTRIHWENEPDTSTPLDKDNLNHMDAALKAFDLLIKEIGNNSMVFSDIANCLSGQPTINQSTGVMTFPKKDGGAYTLDTLLEKVIVNFDFDQSTQELIIYLQDGTEKRVSLSAFIQETEFTDSTTIGFTVDNHNVTATVKANSIGDAQMQTNYLADCQSARSDAMDAADNANADALKAEGHAVGQQNGADVDSSSPYYHNNAKYYKEQAQAIADNSFSGLSDVDFDNLQDGDVPVYNATERKWKNGVLDIVAVKETSPTTAAHAVGDYIRYDGITYKVKSEINIGDSLVLDTNIEANGLPDGTTIFTPEEES